MEREIYAHPKGIYIFFHGLGPTILDSQVILTVNEMRKMGVDIEIWSFSGRSKEYLASLQYLDSVKDKYLLRLRVFYSFRWIIPGTEFINAIILANKIYKYKMKFDFIHARTDYSACVCGFVKLFYNFNLIWDCRGDTEAEFVCEYKANNLFLKIIKELYRYRLKWITFCASAFCDKAIFVSDQLKLINAKAIGEKPVEIISCAASKELFFFSSEERDDVRRKLNYSVQNIVLVYSGSLSTYQCFDETIALVQELYNISNEIRFLILTPYIELCHSKIIEMPQGICTVLSVDFASVRFFLNAADFGLMIRKKDKINAVASPVKFAEYCLCGLPIITTDAVKQVEYFGGLLNNIVYLEKLRETLELHALDIQTRRSISQKAIELCALEKNLEKLSKIYL